jgi:sec-independent protein translocase protein TatC
MRRFFAGVWRAITFPFALIFKIVAFPFRAVHQRFPKFFPGLWKVVAFPFVFVFKVVTFPFRALYRRFPKFFDRLWKIVSFPFNGIRRFHKFLNTEPDERPLPDVFADLVSDQDTRQMMWEQVDALRMHILRAVLSLVVTVLLSFFFTQQFMEFLALPIGGLEKMTSVDMTESVGVFMRVALFSGIALAVPYIAFELWLFAAPGLHPHEKKLGLGGIPFALLFFVGGAAFTYYVMLPAALPFLMNFIGMKTDPRPQSYFSLVTGLMFWIGLFFEFPLVIYILSAIGFVKPQTLLQQWRLAVVIITIIAAAITPTVDPVNQALVMLPMISLYFLGIGFSYVAYAGRKRKMQQEEEQ